MAITITPSLFSGSSVAVSEKVSHLLDGEHHFNLPEMFTLYLCSYAKIDIPLRERVITHMSALLNTQSGNDTASSLFLLAGGKLVDSIAQTVLKYEGMFAPDILHTFSNKKGRHHALAMTKKDFSSLVRQLNERAAPIRAMSTIENVLKARGYCNIGHIFTPRSTWRESTELSD